MALVYDNYKQNCEFLYTYSCLSQEVFVIDILMCNCIYDIFIYCVCVCYCRYVSMGNSETNLSLDIDYTPLPPFSLNYSLPVPTTDQGKLILVLHLCR